MAQHVIVGAGAVGSATAQMLAERGDTVRLISRRGTGPEYPAIERVTADATDADRLAELAKGAVALYNCANPLYHQWPTSWPPLAASLLTAAERSEATLVTMSCLYGYGPVDATITPETPLAATHPKLRIRADMWRDALAAHDAGRIRAVEVRASDYIEANGLLATGVGAALLKGSTGFSIAPLDVLHSWTSITDVARTLIAVSTDERAWGKGWLCPTNAPLTVRQLAERFTEANGVPKAKLMPVPYPVLWSMGVFSPVVKELRATHYQFARPFVIDSSSTIETFGIKPIDMDDALRAAAAAVRV